MTRRKQGFTLIELLVVIAIIGILAAMLFPVFARARESARKTQCLANVKNIAMAFQIYFTDYDRYMPKEHDQAALTWFGDNACEGSATAANPYLRVPVILDEYIKSREVWRCPSAKMLAGANFIRYTEPGGWLKFTADNCGNFGDCCCGFCQDNYPPGWGGRVTDSYKQGQATTGGGRDQIEGAFVRGIESLDYNYQDKSISTWPDAAKQVICMDGAMLQYGKILHDAYPDICRIDRIGIATSSSPDGCTADWEGCPWTTSCSALSRAWFWDPNVRKNSARHMGGLNIGYMDGHAKWANSEAIIQGAEKPYGPSDFVPTFLGLAYCRDPQYPNPDRTCTFIH